MTSTAHILGLHWMRFHQDGEDFPHIARMGYKSYTLFEWMWKDRDFCSELLKVAAPDAIFLLRDHPLSEQKENFVSHPVETGLHHAEEWERKWDAGTINLPQQRCYHLGINEPDSNQHQRQIEGYTLAFVDRLDSAGLKAAGYSFSVGHPSTVNLDPKGKPDWSWYKDSAQALIETGGIAAMHEYYMPGDFGMGYWTLRLQHCPYKLRFVIKESGIDSGVVHYRPIKGENGIERGVGYKHYFPPEKWGEFLSQVDEYQAILGMDERVHSVQLFTYDTNSDWDTFDVRPLRALMEQYKWTPRKTLAAMPYGVHLPVVQGQGPSVITPPPPAVEETQELSTVRKRLIWPMKGTVTQEWGERPEYYREKLGIPYHNGIDIAAPLGTAVVAVADGVVEYVGTDPGYGNYVRVFHVEHGFHSFCAHLSRVSVQIGTRVLQGQTIGECGSTGLSTGPHVHYETRLGRSDAHYVKGTFGHNHGRVDPRSVHWMVNRTYE
jgi:hypothetical protein